MCGWLPGVSWEVVGYLVSSMLLAHVRMGLFFFNLWVCGWFLHLFVLFWCFPYCCYLRGLGFVPVGESLVLCVCVCVCALYMMVLNGLILSLRLLYASFLVVSRSALHAALFDGVNTIPASPKASDS